jgi:dihydroceramidase
MPPSVGAAGFWADRGAPALVNWCEPDYVVSAYVAEWWNTLTSLGMVLIGAAGLWSVRDAGWRFRLGMVGLAAVGAGSAGFHGTLLRVAQAADELPMVAVGLMCVWTLLHRADPPRRGARSAVALLAFGVVFTATYATVPWAFALFIGLYTVMIGWVCVRTVQLTWGRPASAGLRRAALGMILGYVGSFLFFWLPEHALLACDHPLQALQLHSFWHLGGGVGTASWWIWARLDRDRALTEVRERAA